MIPALRVVTVCLILCAGCRATKQQVIVVHDRIPECPSGPVSVYQAGTSTLVPLYADPELKLKMVNPFTPICEEGNSYTFYTNISNLRIVESEIP